MLKRFESPLIWIVFFLLLGGTAGFNLPFLLLAVAIIIHFA